MRILITGARGFIGRHLSQHFSAVGTVTDISLRQTPLQSLELAGYDCLIHLSGVVHQSGASAAHHFQINRDQTLKLAERAKAAGVRQFLFFSTMAVYGQQGALQDFTPLTEQSPCQPETPYGQSKHAAEQALQALADGQFRVAIIRPPMVYGPACPGNMSRLQRLVERLPLLPLGWQKNRRALVSIGNLTRFVDAIVRQQQQGIFLPQDPTPLSLRQICQALVPTAHRRWLFSPPVSLVRLGWRLRPALFASLYGSLYYDNRQTLQQLTIEGLESSAGEIAAMRAHHASAADH